MESSQESEPHPTPPVLATMRIQRDTMPDGRTVLYYSWPPQPSRTLSKDADV